MELYLVQHGEAVAKNVDPARPLSEKGQRDIKRLAAFLNRAGISAVRAVHSGKLRARQTVEGLAPLLTSDQYIETRDDMNPNDSTVSLTKQIASWTDNTLLVGHLPFMDRLLSNLLTGSETISVAAYVPGTLVCLAHGEDNLWKIAWMIRPGLLAEPSQKEVQ